MLRILLERIQPFIVGHVLVAGMLGAVLTRVPRGAQPLAEPADLSEDPIDRGVLDSLRELGAADDPTLLSELIDSFLVNTDLRLEKLRAALEREDAEMLSRAAHSLKGSSGTFGAVNLGALCQQMQEIVDHNGTEAARDRMRQIEVEYERVKQALAVELGRAEP